MTQMAQTKQAPQTPQTKQTPQTAQTAQTAQMGHDGPDAAMASSTLVDGWVRSNGTRRWVVGVGGGNSAGRLGWRELGTETSTADQRDQWFGRHKHRSYEFILSGGVGPWTNRILLFDTNVYRSIGWVFAGTGSGGEFCLG